MQRLQMFSKYMHSGQLLQLPNFPDVYTGPTFPVWIQQCNLQPKYIDIVAVFSTPGNDGRSIIRLSVLNRHPTADWKADLRFDGFSQSNVQRTTLGFGD